MSDPVHDGPAMNQLIHQAVLRDLDAFAAALDAFSAGDQARATSLAARFGWLDRLLTSHHEGEERHLWPVLKGQPADTAEVAELTDEHEHIVSALGTARENVRRFGASATAQDAAAAKDSVITLRSTAAEHFEHEQREMTDLCAHADQKALAVALKKMGRGVPLREGLWFIQWVSDGASPPDTAFLRRLIPPPVHWLSRRVAGRDYARVSAPLRG